MLRATQLRQTAKRNFGGHADQTKPFEPPHVEAWHTHTGSAFMTVMWLWLFYKFEHDGPIVFVSSTILYPLSMFIVFRISTLYHPYALFLSLVDLICIYCILR